MYLSGPMFNVFTALASMTVYRYFPYEMLKFFYMCNIVLFIMNMLPALPLDGGIIVKKCLMYRFGCRTAKRIMNVISAVIAAAVVALGIYAIYMTKMNFSIFLFALLMIGNMFTQNEKYNVDFVRELMFHDKKKKNNVKHIIANISRDYRDIANDFNMHSYSVIYLTDNEGEIVRIMTESQVMKELTNSNITV